MRYLRKPICLLSVVLLFVLASEPVLAAKIKKKDGQVIEGKINGLVVQKGMNTTANAVSYSLIKGGYIESIDESGLSLRAGSKFLYALTRQKEIPIYSGEEAEIIGFVSGIFGGMDENSGIYGNIGVGGGVAAKYLDRKEVNARDILVGTWHAQDRAEKVHIIPSLEVVTASGTTTIPVNEIVGLKNRAENQKSGRQLNSRTTSWRDRGSATWACSPARAARSWKSNWQRPKRLEPRGRV